MNKETISQIMKRLETEIHVTQKGREQTESLLRLKEIAKMYSGEDKVISFGDIAERLKTQAEELKIMTGWTQFDELIRGFRPQQLVVVSAATKQGKTSYLMDLTTRIRQHNPLWFPFEESAEELIRKYIERGQTPPHGYTPQNINGNRIDWIETKIVESIAKFGTQVVFIDQLDFIVEMSGDNHALRVGDTVRKLKALAKKWNVVIFLICHLVKTNMEMQPTLEDLKGSSSIAQEADTVIMLWRETKREAGQVVTTNNVNVSVQANRRHGKTGNVKMAYINGTFIEQDWVSEHENNAKQERDFESLTFKPKQSPFRSLDR